ncbi:MAG: hypothetical protein EZS28_014781 [Streblomastix strix]|uniref:Vacuolar protein sorting-associated protein 54 N-terminal domain-containing protein n=1 Tax=Streblomastix strix TaxID=222440 RepID=A0A5J4W4P3_9EUKA|nr:MAG: hypothetical protein EZS28_014781 [Streblomastix strix]
MKGQREEDSLPKKIPNFFFNPDFQFSDPRIFNQIIALSPNQSFANSQILSEKLLNYVDETELGIGRTLSKKQQIFLRTVDLLAQLKDKIDSAKGSTIDCRIELQTTKETLVQDGLRINKLHLRKERLIVVGETIKKITNIQKLVHDMEEKHQTGDFIGAIQTADKAKEAMEELRGMQLLLPLAQQITKTITSVREQLYKNLQQFGIPSSAATGKPLEITIVSHIKKQCLIQMY